MNMQRVSEAVEQIETYLDNSAELQLTPVQEAELVCAVGHLVEFVRLRYDYAISCGS